MWQNRTARGQWSVQDSTEHVNVLELRAVHLTHINHQGRTTREGSQVARGSSQCLSTISSDLTNTSQGTSPGPQSSPGGPLLASQDLVSTATQTPLWEALAPPQQEGPPVSVGGSDLTSRPLSSSAVGLATEGPDSLVSDCVDPVKKTILNAKPPSTRLQYQNRVFFGFVYS